MLVKNKKARVVSALLALAVLLAAIPSLPLYAAADVGVPTEQLTTTVFNCRFESDPFERGWDTEDFDGDGAAWQVTPYDGVHHFTKGSVCSEIPSPGSSAQIDNRLLSPRIHLPQNGTNTVSVWACASSVFQSREKLYFGYVTLPRGEYHILEGSEFFAGAEWSEFSFELPEELSGKHVRLCLIHGSGGSGVRLLADDFTVTNRIDFTGPVMKNYVLMEQFNLQDPFTSGWQTTDVDGDGLKWTHEFGTATYHTPYSAVYSASYAHGPLNPYNDLLSPAVVVPKSGVTTVGVWARSYGNSEFCETMRFFCKTDDELETETWLGGDIVTTDGWAFYTVNIPAYVTGQWLRIGISHYNTEGTGYLYIDDFEIVNRVEYPAGTVYANNFETDPMINGWGERDVDGDGNGWDYAPFGGEYHWTRGNILSASRLPSGEELTPNNWIWTPSLDIPESGTTIVSLWAKGTDIALCHEGFNIAYSAESGDRVPVVIREFVTGRNWKRYCVVLPRSLAGERARIVITHCNCTGQGWLTVDEIAVTNMEYTRGDLDADGEITVSDTLRALRFAARVVWPEFEDVLIGDIDGDEDITVTDALAILRVAVGLADPGSL